MRASRAGLNIDSQWFQWHEHPVLRAWIQGRVGGLLLWGLATALIAWLDIDYVSVLIISPAIFAVMYRPDLKREILSVASLAVILNGLLKLQGVSFHDPFDLVAGLAGIRWSSVLLQYILVLSALFVAWLGMRYIQWWPPLARRHPVIVLHFGVWLALYLGQFWGLALASQAAYIVWRMSYMAQFAQRGLMAESRFQDHLFYLMPAFGSTNSPFGKGAQFLSRFEARDGEALARSQLAGFKLLLLAVLWLWVDQLIGIVLFSEPSSRFPVLNSLPSLGWPSLDAAIAAEPSSVSWIQAWLIVAVALVVKLLGIAVSGHVMVACLRLTGFHVFRNTYKPLLSLSIVEYWGRYYYYFKEVLVEFFFYPAYLWFRGLTPPLRLFAAVFSAAFVGNIYFHVFYTAEYVIAGDFAFLWDKWGTRTIYCALLATGIWISMLRRQANPVDPKTLGAWVRLRKMAGVWLFFGLIQVWNQKSTESDTVDAFRFFFRLLGVTG